MALAQSYITVTRRPPDVEDYIDMMRRYRSWILGPTFAGLVISTVVAFFWPDTFVSKAVLRIIPQQISSRLIPSDITTLLSERIQTMQQQILSRTNLEGLIRSPALDLYKRERDIKPMEDVVDGMRKDIVISFLGGPAAGGGDGRTTTAAFSISFTYPNKYIAQKVVSDLVSRFTEQNQTVQKQESNLATVVVDSEYKDAKDKLDEIDQKITQFNIANQGKLPEEAQANQAFLNSLTMQGSTIAGQLQTARNQQMSLETALRGYEASKALWEGRQEETVNTPQSQVTNQQLIETSARLQQAEGDLAAMQKTYGARFPQVQDLKGRIDLLKQRKSELEQEQEKKVASAPTTGPTKVINPAVQMQVQAIANSIDQTRTAIAQAMSEIQRLTALMADNNRKIDAYQSRIAAGPLNAQQYAILSREHIAAQENFDLQRKRKDSVNTSRNVQEHQAGESLEVLDTASLPEQPTDPKRGLWAAAGTGIGLMIGIMLAGAKEVKNTSLKNLKDVRAYTNMPVLSSIPLLENALLVRRKRRLYWLAWSVALIVGFVAIGSSMYYYYFAGK